MEVGWRWVTRRQTLQTSDAGKVPDPQGTCDEWDQAAQRWSDSHSVDLFPTEALRTLELFTEFCFKFSFREESQFILLLALPPWQGESKSSLGTWVSSPLFPVTSEGDTKGPGMALPEVVRVLRVGKGFSIGDGRAHFWEHGGPCARPLPYLVSMTIRGRAEVLTQINTTTTLHWAAVGPVLHSVPFVCGIFNLSDQPAREAVCVLCTLQSGNWSPRRSMPSQGYSEGVAGGFHPSVFQNEWDCQRTSKIWNLRPYPFCFLLRWWISAFKTGSLC